MDKLGVVIVGVNGAVASTLIAGIELMVQGHAPRIGMLTEKTDAAISDKLTDLLDFVPLENLVFGGWDLQFKNVYEATRHHKVLTGEQLEPIKAKLEAMKPWPAVFSTDYAANCPGENVVHAKTFREQIALLESHIEAFKKEHKLSRVVMVNLASTERYLEPAPVYETIEAFEKGLDNDDPAISPAMRYFYLACKMGVPYANFTPSLTNVPALETLAVRTKTPYAGMDGKTGQTLVKTTLAAMFRTRRLHVEGWYSVNVLGNNDGLVLNNPASNKTKVLSKASVLDSIVGYQVANHQVHIHYYKPRGDAKEAWDNIDLIGFGGIPMQMKVNFLCQDSVLAAPLVVDMVRLLDLAKVAGEKGIQRQLSIFFKSPYVSPGEQPEHDLFKQEKLLLDWAQAHSNRSAKTAKKTEAKAQTTAN
jgi:myo-inositol-1-phosphate synthase